MQPFLILPPVTESEIPQRPKPPAPPNPYAAVVAAIKIMPRLRFLPVEFQDKNQAHRGAASIRAYGRKVKNPLTSRTSPDGCTIFLRPATRNRPAAH